jgi:pyruvate/2-oxoglutarate dehydrogenase complex dihydrolipoamide acyltransferase (E2) component
MRVIRNLTGTLLIAGMASMAYASSPRPINSGVTASAAQQEQETPPKQDDSKPAPKPKSQTDTKPAPKAGQQSADKTQQAARNQQKQHPAQAQKGQASGAHGKIKDTDYQAHFGRSHSFTVRTVITTTTIVPHQTQFVYSGYSFIFLAPWPSGWVLTDPCYVDYVDGEYVLIDLAHPGMTIALEIAG